MEQLVKINGDYYSSVFMGYSQSNIRISIDGVYQNGIVYRITCFPDYTMGMEVYESEIYTSGLLVCINNQNPEFILELNDDKEKKINEALGLRIDQKLFDYSDNIFNHKRKEKIRNLTHDKVILIIKKSLESLNEIEKENQLKLNKK